MFPSRHSVVDWTDDDSEDSDYCVEIPNPFLLNSPSVSPEEEITEAAPLASRGEPKPRTKKTSSRKRGPLAKPTSQG